MKCPKCDSYNKSEYVKCYLCGCVLDDSRTSSTSRESSGEYLSDDERYMREDNITDINQERKLRKTRDASRMKNISFGDIELDPSTDSSEKSNNNSFRITKKTTKKIMQRQKGIWNNDKSRSMFGSRRDTPVIVLDDETDKKKEDNQQNAFRRKRVEPSENQTKIHRFVEGAEVKVVIPQAHFVPEPVNTSKRPQKTLRKVKWARLLLVCLISAGIIFGGVIGMFYLFEGISSGFANLFVPRDTLPNDGQPLVERVLKDGQTWHRITFFGLDGERILVEDNSHELKRTLTIHDGKAELMLDDYAYIPESDDEEFFGLPFTYVDLIASHFDEEGTETVLDVPIYRISIPLAPLAVIHPIEQSLEFLNTQVMVKVKVDIGSRILIGSKNMTGNVDADGYTSTYINLDPIGENIIPITVEVDGYRINRYELLVNNPQRDIEIEYLDAKTEIRTDSVIINGVTEAGALLTTDAVLMIDKIKVDNNGEFYIKIKLNDYGWNVVNLYAAMPDGRKTTLTHEINRIPYEGSYTSSAWVLDYPALTTSANAMIGQKYKLIGKIFERIDTPKAKLFKLNVGTDIEYKFVIIEYNGLYDLKKDVIYEVYADVTGKYENIPRLNARFIYVSKDQDGDGEPDPEPTDENEDANEDDTTD